MIKIFRKIFDHEYKELEKFKLIANDVFALEDKYAKMSDKNLQAMTSKLKKRLADGETLDDLIPDAFAVVREAAYRVIGEKPFYVQVLGALAIHFGNISEMKTGEGKTLTCVMPAYLKSCYVVTKKYIIKRSCLYAASFLTVKVNK